MADFSAINGQVVAGQGGEGVLIETIAVKFDTNNTTKQEMAFVEFTGTAHTVLNNPYSVNSGYKDLPEPLPVSTRIEISLEDGDAASKKDLSITYDQFNKTFDTDLVDRPDEWERFMKDGTNSVYDKIFGKPAYFSAKLANGKTGEKAADFYFNIRGQAKIVEPVLDEVKKRKEAIRQRKEAERLKKEKAEAEFAGVGADSSDPIPF